MPTEMATALLDEFWHNTTTGFNVYFAAAAGGMSYNQVNGLHDTDVGEFHRRLKHQHELYAFYDAMGPGGDVSLLTAMWAPCCSPDTVQFLPNRERHESWADHPAKRMMGP